ncbi:hypothetical protein [Thalassoroseus pseudoceratinae]|uniref:hypothetical protein n=1 Tax=Thalassoroseus pseudoceratinae TaxID=2713176 RepID=UPI001420A933|nr:hypothetical protein [Thalassoroseus pseudoceratinae]
MSEFNFAAVQELIQCPASGAALLTTGDALISTDPEQRLRYAIVNGIPNLIVEDAESMPLADWQDFMRQSHRDPESGQLLDSNAS